VFKGEDYGLHTRVFMNGKGLPTYEAKELGLETLKQREYPQARLVIVTANEVTDYFRVVKKALELIDAPLSEKLAHVPHGMMKLPTGKMSSRTGDVITGESLLHDLAEAARERARESRADDANVLAQQIAVAAIKFQVLRGATSKDIVFDREQALSLEGDSGPYLQYAFARTQAILAKASEAGVFAHAEIAPEPNIVARLLVRFPSVAERAAREYAPHHVAQYLLELAGAFNSWYAREQILDGSVHAGNKVAITAAVGNTIKHGLWLLGIPAPERM
jgi:arginyl-tRNA synthetase